MALSALGQIPLYTAAALENTAVAATPSIPVVVLTGLSLVFGILVILYLVLLSQGRIFKGIDAKKRARLEEEKRAEQAALPIAETAPAAQAVVLTPPRAQPQTEGIPPEVVAAIAAAVAEVGEGQYTLQSITPAAAPVLGQAACRKAERRGQWGFAGVIASTEPF